MNNLAYTYNSMTRIIRTATIQARVLPLVKVASERILWNIGLNMSEAVELFLRRIIVDRRIPFDVVALDADMLAGADASIQSTFTADADVQGKTNRGSRLRQPSSGTIPRKKLKSFSGRGIDQSKGRQN